MFKIIKLLAAYCAVSVIAHGAEYKLLCDTPSGYATYAAYFFLVPCDSVDAVCLPHVLSCAVQGPVSVYGLSNAHLNDFLCELSHCRSQNTKSPKELIFPVPRDELLAFDSCQAQSLLQYLCFKQLPATTPYVIVRGSGFENAYNNLTRVYKEAVDARLENVKSGDFGETNRVKSVFELKFRNDFAQIRVYYIVLDRYVGVLFVGGSSKQGQNQQHDIQRAEGQHASMVGLINSLKSREDKALHDLGCN